MYKLKPNWQDAKFYTTVFFEKDLTSIDGNSRRLAARTTLAWYVYHWFRYFFPKKKTPYIY